MNDIKHAAAMMGAKGGSSGTGEAKRRTPEQCRKAAKARWKKYRAALKKSS